MGVLGFICSILPTMAHVRGPHTIVTHASVVFLLCDLGVILVCDVVQAQVLQWFICTVRSVKMRAAGHSGRAQHFNAMLHNQHTSAW